MFRLLLDRRDLGGFSAFLFFAIIMGFLSYVFLVRVGITCLSTMRFLSFLDAQVHLRIPSDDSAPHHPANRILHDPFKRDIRILYHFPVLFLRETRSS